jgi:sugar fermentation stimulation protein A
MNFENPLIAGVLIKRYKRFFADIKVKDQIITSHCPNTGSMMGLLKDGNKAWISMSNNEKRKLKYTLQIIEDKKNKVGVNTHITNRIVEEALIISEKNKKSFIEVKNVTLCRKNRIAEFPDSVTTRGAKHITDLIEAKKQGFKSYLLYLVQREDCDEFNIANDIDPNYSKLLTAAIKKNVKILCYDCKFSSKGIKLNKKIKINIDD